VDPWQGTFKWVDKEELIESLKCEKQLKDDDVIDLMLAIGFLYNHKFYHKDTLEAALDEFKV